MKKNLLTLLSALFISTISFAQFKVLATGNGFEEPENGYVKIIQEKNGYTFYFHATKSSGINVKIYDESHTEIVDKKINPEYGNLNLGSRFFEIDPGTIDAIKGIYEIDNNIVIFVNEYKKGIPTLYRIIIDGKTGDLKSEETIGTLSTYNLLESYAVRAGYVPLPTFYVRKDAESDNYAVVLFDALNSDRNKRIEIVHYNKSHQEISRAFYESPNNAYKYLNFMDACVRGDKEAIVVVVGKNTSSSGGDLNGTLLIGSLKAGEHSFELQKLSYPEAGRIQESMIRYNKYKDEYMLLSIKPSKDKKDKNAKCYRTVIKSVGGEAITTMINSGPINRIANKHYDKKDQFLAIPQILNINDDGGYTIVFEENKAVAGSSGMMVYNSTPGPGGSTFTQSNMGSAPKFYLEDIGIIEYNADGTEKATYYIPKSQFVYEIPKAIYYSFREETAIKLYKETQYKSFFFLNTKNKRYILINDDDQNQERVDKNKKVTTVQGLGDSKAFYLDLNSDGEIPKRQLVFEDDNERKRKDMQVITAPNYDSERNVLVVLKFGRKEKGGKDVKLVWLQPE